MSATRIVVDVLLADPDVNEAVGNDVFGVSAPQGTTLPYVLARLVSETDAQMVDGPAVWPVARVEVSCVAADAAEADALGETVKRALQGVTNRSVGAFTGTVFKASADVMDEADDRRVFRRIMDFEVRWR